MANDSGFGGEDGMPLVETAGIGPVCRTASCVEDPQGTAMSALQSNNLRLLSDLLSEEGAPVSVDKTYPSHSYRTMLHTALDMSNKRAVGILLSAGAKADHFNTTLKITPIHVAANKTDAESMSLFLRSVDNKNALNIRDRSGRTPIHLSVMTKGASGLSCLRQLLDAGAETNIQDNKGGQTPLYVAAACSNYEAVKLLLERGADLGIDCQDQSTRDLILYTFSQDQVKCLNLDIKQSSSSNMTKDQIKNTLFTLVDKAELDGEKDTAKWNKLVAMATNQDLNQNNGKHTLVQLCSEKGLQTYLTSLLSAGADPNLTTLYRATPPVLLAATGGQVGTVQVLANYKADFTVVERESGQSVLHTVIRKPLQQLGLSRSAATTGIDYEACLDVLLDKELMGVQLVGLINKQDLLGNTALHYATQFWDQETVTRLLLLGANIGLKNKMGEAPISNILPTTMESFLDTHCLKSEGNPTNEDFRVTFHYDFLAPPRDNRKVDIIAFKDSEIGNCPPADPQPETDVLWYMSKSKDHRHLLKHPVITSFLALKWSRISGHYNSNLVFFGILVACLTAYIFINYAGYSLGVSHPICVNSSIVESSLPVVQAMPYGNSPALWWVNAVLLGLLVFRELLQLGISPSQHLGSVENMFELMLIILTGLLLFDNHPGCNLQFKRDIACAAIFFSWIEMVTMVGRHPMLSSYNIYSTMFYRVLKTFLSFLAWYSVFILAFGLGFYILLHDDVLRTKEKEYFYFDNLGLALVKTYSMFVGELEFSNIPLNSPFSYFFFLIFIFLIVVVLMNLLNGLAVSDTGKIREEAEIHAHVCRVEVIAQAEATLLGDPAHLLKGSGLISQLIPTCGLRRKIGTALGIKSIFRKMTGGKSVLLFFSQLPDKKLVIYPNKLTRLCSPCSSEKELGRDITKSAKNLVLRLNEVGKTKNLEIIVETIREKQECLDKKIDDIMRSLEKITKSIIN